MSENNQLKRQLNPINVWAIAFGCIIGWGSFINPGKKFLPNSGVYGTAIAMALGGLVMIVIAFSYAYMIPKCPKAGGEFSFTMNCFGKTPAFICGWFLVAAYLTNIPMNLTAIGLIVDGLDGNLDVLKFGWHYTLAGFDVWLGEILLASFILVLLGILNIRGVRKAGFVQTVLASLLAVCTITLCVSAIISGKASKINFSPVWGFDKVSAIADKTSIKSIQSYAHTGNRGILIAVLATFAIAPWAFVGFDTIPQEAEEFKFSYGKVMLIMVVAIIFGFFVYVANNTVTAAVLENWPELVMEGKWVLLVAAEKLLGPFGKVLVGIGVSCAVLSGIMGFYLASSRLLFSMSRDGFLPRLFSVINPKYGTPQNAIIFCMIVSFAGPLLGREALGWFVDMSAIGASIAYFFTCASTVYTINREKDESLLIKVMAYIGVFFSLLFMVLQLVPIPGLNGVHFGKESYIMLFVWIIIGLVFRGFRLRKAGLNNNQMI